MKWISKFTLLLVGFVIGQSIPNSSAQKNLGLTEMQMYELQLQTEIRNYAKEDKEKEAAKIRQEFEADKRHFAYTQEVASLWLMLVQREDEMYETKWNGIKSFVDAQKHLEVTLLKQELKKRAKEIDKHLK